MANALSREAITRRAKGAEEVEVGEAGDVDLVVAETGLI